MIKVAVLVDGGFYHRRCGSLFRKISDYRRFDSEQAASIFNWITNAHIDTEQKHYLYRIFYYDAWPLDKRVHNPVTGRSVDFGTSEIAVFRTMFFEALKHQRKVALRLGKIKDHGGWMIRSTKTKELLKGSMAIRDLRDVDVTYDVTQKGVDMKIGLDIAALSYKKLVDKIVLISGDSDFVPAAKVARREGIDVVLDPMWNRVEPTLFEHIDGVYSTVPHPEKMPDSISQLVEGTQW